MGIRKDWFSFTLTALIVSSITVHTVCYGHDFQSGPFIRALNQVEYAVLRNQSTNSETSHSSLNPATTINNVDTNNPRPIIFIPSFQGTILSHCSDSQQCTPIYLSPMSPNTYRPIYSLLSDKSTNIVKPLPKPFGSFENIEYPAYTCGRSPFSHIGHCNPLPARGPVDLLIKYLQSRNYVPNENLFGIAYDWRQNTNTILSSEPFTTFLPSQLQKQVQSTVIAHGTGCNLMNQFFQSNDHTNVARFICLSPVSSYLAKESQINGEGLLTIGNASHRYIDPMTSARVPGRLDFRAMEFELGLRPGRRSSVPDIVGPWHEKGLCFVGTMEERRQFAKRLPAVEELANEIDEQRGLHKASLCVLANDIENEEHVTKCQETVKAVQTNVDHMDLVGLIKEVV